MLIISDSSPLICFAKINRLNILHQLFGQIIIPPKVSEEIKSISTIGFSIEEFAKADWVAVSSPKNQTLFSELILQVDAAEAEAITLAKELQSDFLLIDERKGTSIARNLGIKTIGVVGIIIRAKEKNLIASGKAVLDELRDKPKFWLSEEVYKAALKILNE